MKGIPKRVVRPMTPPEELTKYGVVRTCDATLIARTNGPTDGDGQTLESITYGPFGTVTSGASTLDLKILSSDTAIQPLMIGDSETAVRISDKLFDAGFLISAIRPPTVPEGSARLRITLTAEHTEEQIDRLLETLGKLL